MLRASAMTPMPVVLAEPANILRPPRRPRAVGPVGRIFRVSFA